MFLIYFFNKTKIAEIDEIWMDESHKTLYQFKMQFIFLNFFDFQKIIQYIFAHLNLFIYNTITSFMTFKFMSFSKKHINVMWNLADLNYPWAGIKIFWISYLGMSYMPFLLFSSSTFWKWFKASFIGVYFFLEERD